MSEDKQFTHLFPEWQLAYALEDACKRDLRAFWSRPLARTIRGSSKLRSLEEICGYEPQLSLHHEKPLPTDGAKAYGIAEDEYARGFLGLMPDFRVDTPNHSLIVILEAKSRWDAPPAHRPLKEDRYLQFLEKAKIPSRKGFFYVVPEKVSAGYSALLEQHPESPGGMSLGVIAWEHILPLIGDDLIKRALEQLFSISDGLRRLRTWQEQQEK